MKKFVSIATAAAVVMSVSLPSTAFAAQDEAATTEAATPAVEVQVRKMLYDVSGKRLATIYSVTTEGDPQVILDGRMRTIPASTLSNVDGKITTSLTKSEIMHGS